MRACAVEMDMRNSKSNFCASRPTQNAETTRANPDLNPLNSYRKNPLVRSTIWGNIGDESLLACYLVEYSYDTYGANLFCLLISVSTLLYEGFLQSDAQRNTP